MSYVDSYRRIHISLLDRSYNCSHGNTWVWSHVAQCLEQPNHFVGFVTGFLAVILCATAYISLTIARARNNGYKGYTRLSAVMYWFSEVMSLFGAVLSLQLPTQILYSIIMTPVYSICCTYAFIQTTSKSNKKHNRAKSKKQSILRKCIYPFYMLLPAVLLIAFQTYSVSIVTKDVDDMFDTRLDENGLGIPVFRFSGYVLGIMAGLLLGCVRVVEIIHVYSSFEALRCFPLVYVARVAGSMCYIYSVISQSMSSAFIYHSSPWTISRLVTIGMDVGILTQRLLQYSRQKQRHLSEEGTRSLLSSDTEDFGTGSESEEIIWMPLKIVEAVQPQNSPNIQILTVSESSSDSQDIQRSVPDLTVVPGQASLPEEIKLDHIPVAKNADCVSNDVKKEVGNENVRNGSHLNGVSNEMASDVRNGTGNASEHEYGQNNTISDSSASSIDSENTSERKHLTENNNCTKHSVAKLGSVTTVEKIHSWIKTSN